MKNFILPSVNVYVVNKTKLLLSRRANTGWMDGHLCAPGGHVEPGETPVAAMLREIKEELGAEVDPTHLDFLCVAARNTAPHQYVAYQFLIRDQAYHFENTEPNKCSELAWVDPKRLPHDVIDDFRQIISRAVLAGERYLELGY